MLNASGGCLCGAVRYHRYQLNAEPVMVAVCHCATCQKNTGSAFSTNLAMPTDAVEIAGDGLTTYVEHVDAGAMPFFRSYCSRCGSPICGQGKAYPGFVFIKAGTLDDPSWVTPTVHMWCAEKQPWVTIGDDVPQLAAGPTSQTGNAAGVPFRQRFYSDLQLESEKQAQSQIEEECNHA